MRRERTARQRNQPETPDPESIRLDTPSHWRISLPVPTTMKPIDPVLQQQVEAFHKRRSLTSSAPTYSASATRSRCHDISLTQRYALEALLRHGPSTLNALAAKLHLDKSTASRVVAALERKGYVGRAQHPGDARAVLLDVTPAGRRLHDRIRADRIAERTELLCRLCARKCARASPTSCGASRTPPADA